MAEFPRLKKSLGQHFLTNATLAGKIVDLLAPEPGDQILEIGPGRGRLTELLIQRPHARLALIEKDDYWAAYHAGQGRELLAADALQFDWPSLRCQGEWKLIGNLPYNVASPLIWDIVSSCSGYSRAVFMTQKEVAARICAKPDSRAYGALSVWVQAHARPKLEFDVAPGSFRPPPKVDSAVISLTPAIDRPAHPDCLRELLQICFQQRRKQLAGIFRRAGKPGLESAMQLLQVDGQLRPENLDCRQFVALADAWRKMRQES